jgi:hypothetical protein
MSGRRTTQNREPRADFFGSAARAPFYRSFRVFSGCLLSRFASCRPQAQILVSRPLKFRKSLFARSRPIGGYAQRARPLCVGHGDVKSGAVLLKAGDKTTSTGAFSLLDTGAHGLTWIVRGVGRWWASSASTTTGNIKRASCRGKTRCPW